MINFVVDSTFNIDSEFAKENNIRVVDLKITLNDKEYVESEVANWAEFYRELKTTKAFPKSSCPTPNDFTSAFNEILENDKDAEIICLTFSKNLSGTFNSARIAGDEFSSEHKNKIEIIDLQSYTCSSKLILEDAINDVAQNMSFEKVIENINANIEKTWVKFVPYSMEPLKKGGRISLLTSIIGNTLHIKPVLSFFKGEFKKHKLALGMIRALHVLSASIVKAVKKINIMFIEDNTFALKLKEVILKQHSEIKDCELISLGPVAGTHIGIGSIGIAVMDE